MNEETGEVKLLEGRILDYAEQSKLIELIDIFMDHRAVNTARHTSDVVDWTAIEIETLLTEAGWYPQ